MHHIKKECLLCGSLKQDARYWQFTNVFLFIIIITNLTRCDEGEEMLVKVYTYTK